jgi:hypothetical protein
VGVAPTMSGYREMVTAVMSAHAQGKKSGLWSTGCSLIPFWGGTVTDPIAHDVWVTD